MEIIVSNLNIGFQTCKHNHLKIEEEIQLALNNGLNYFDIFFDGFSPDDVSDSQIDKILELKKEGINYTIHSAIADYKEYPKFMDRIIDFSNKIGALTFTIHFDKLSYETIDKILSKLSTNTKLSIENTIPDKNYIYEKNYLEFIKEASKRFKNIYSTFDIGHCFINKYDITEYITKIIDFTQISTFHLHNNDGITDTHNCLNKGNIDVKKIMEFLKSKNLYSIFIIEHWQDNFLSLKYIIQISTD